MGRIDALVCNGDAIDGKGVKTGGTELITSDRAEQAEMAAECLRVAIGPDTSVHLTYGTPYHVGTEEDWEGNIAKELGASIGEHEWIELNGVVFDLKHTIGASSVPTGRHTALNKEALWSHEWASANRIPVADVLIRSHVHYFAACWSLDHKPHWRIITPALQAAATKFGARKCSGLVDFGYVVFDISRPDERIEWDVVTTSLASERARTRIA